MSKSLISSADTSLPRIRQGQASLACMCIDNFPLSLSHPLHGFELVWSLGVLFLCDVIGMGVEDRGSLGGERTGGDERGGGW